MHDTIIVQTRVTFPDGSTHTADITVDARTYRDTVNPLPRDREFMPTEMREAIEQADRRRALGNSIAGALTEHIVEAFEAKDTVNGYSPKENAAYEADGFARQPRLRSLPSQCEIGDYVPASAIRVNPEQTHAKAVIGSTSLQGPGAIGTESAFGAGAMRTATFVHGIFRRATAAGQLVWIRET